MSWSPPSVPPPATGVPPAGPPPGWYPDPSGFGVRWFDGAEWGPSAVPEQQADPMPTLRLRDAIGALVILAASLAAAQVSADVVAELGWPVLVEACVAGLVGYGPSVYWASRILGRERRLHGRRAGEVFGLRFRWLDAGLGPLTYLGAIASQTVLAILIQLTRIPFTSNVDDSADGRTTGYVIGIVVTAVIAAPIVEELIFRGIVLRGLAERMPIAPAVALQGVLFGSAHIDPSRGWGNVGLALALSGVGVALGVSAVLTRRLGPTIVAHAILNGVVLTLVLTGALDNLPSG